MRHKAIFSVGDYTNTSRTSYFAKYDFSPKGYQPSHYNPFAAGNQPEIKKELRPVYGPPSPKEVYGPPSPKQNTGVRQAHIRNLGGKAVMVGQSILKAGQNTAGKLIAGGTTLAGQGVGAATSYAGRGVELLAKNPKTSALVAGGTAVVGGAGFVMTRPKRKRR